MGVDEGISVDESASDWWMLASVIYGAGMLLFLLRNIFVYRNLIRLTKLGKLTRMNDCLLIDSDLIKSPFSVFNYILFNASGLSKTEKI